MHIFISHITEDAPIAFVLQKNIRSLFLGQIAVFASSNVKDLTPGEEWLKKIEEALELSNVLLLICSPSSLTRPWINFEAGCGWIKGIKIIPICHSGQRKDQLPFPLSTIHALQLEDSKCAKSIIEALTIHFGFPEAPVQSVDVFQDELRKARKTIIVTEVPPQIIHSKRERTQLIKNDLEILYNSNSVNSEIVWSSAFLSAFAIGKEDPYPEKDHDYLDLLLQEKEVLMALARKGCTIKCIISPANKNHTSYFGIKYAIQRTKRLLKFLNSNNKELNNIDWTVSELQTKNLYIIGRISCFEGYKKGIQQGYRLTLRQTTLNEINTNINVYKAFFDDLACRMLAKWGSGSDHSKARNKRELFRLSTIRCLEDSLNFLSNLVKSNQEK